MKKLKTLTMAAATTTATNGNIFDKLSDEIIFTILDNLEKNPSDAKAFSLVCKSFYHLESSHRRTLKPLRTDQLPSILARYRNVSHLDFSLCPRVTDSALSAIGNLIPNGIESINLSKSRFFTGLGLSSVMTMNLKEIDLSNATELSDYGVSVIAEAKNLEKLWLGRCKMVTDIGIGCIAVGCVKLKLICLKWCLSVGDLGVELIAVKCPEIRTLDLSYLPITGKCLPAILKLKYLEELILEGCFGIDDDSLVTIKQESSSLKTLDLSSCQNVTHTGLSSLTTSTSCIEQLTLAYGSPVTLDTAQSLQRLSNLQSIRLDGCLVSFPGLQAIGNYCPSLQELSLSKCSGVTDEGLSSILKNQTDLRKLDITCCRKITSLSIAQIADSCTSLTSLRMESCILVPKEAFVFIGRSCHLLEELDVTDNEIDDEGLKSISKCAKLKVLKLGICLNITDKGLAYIGSKCSKLTELDLYRCMEITDTGILSIASGCPALEMINTSYCNEITDRSLISLSKCDKLHTVECRGCPLITSLGVAAIAVGCRQLAKLDIKKCYNINDIGVIPLAHFSHNLRQINLSYTSITDIGLLSLASIGCLQNMTILHLKGLSPRGLAAALLTCRNLTKVKLHTSFKSLLSQLLFDHLEARGCVFQWREKVYQDELEDSKSWKLQLEEMINYES